MTWLQVKKVTKSYGQTEVLRGIDLTIDQGEQIVIRGSSGSGKSTLLYLIGGLDQITSGDIIVNRHYLNQLSDEKLADYRNKTVGFIFQFHYLLPSMNCLQNILLPADIGGVDTSSIKENCLKLAKELQVEHCLKKFPYEISGGEQQRINIIRALSLRPQLLLCDEPTGNLDSKNSERVTSLLKELAQVYGVTLVVVTHDKKVSNHFSREFFMEDGLLYQ